MPKKRPEPEARHAAFVTGIVSFEFWNNDDASYRDKALRDLAKETRHAVNISAVPATDTDEDPETGRIAFAGAARSVTQAENLAKEVMDFLEAHSQARIVNDNWIAEEIP